MSTSPISTPATLWQRLSTGAGLELQVNGRPGRDADIEQSLLRALGAPQRAKSLDVWLTKDATLSKPTVSIERLLVAVLQSQAGFAHMMRDILGTLVAAGARRAPESMRIAFKFEGMDDPIVETLKEFRESVERITQVLASRPVLPDQSQLWAVWEVMRELSSMPMPALTDQFPDVPPPAVTGHAALDNTLEHLTELIHEVHGLWQRHGADRQQVIRAAQALVADTPEQARLRGQLYAASDFWSYTLLANLEPLPAAIASGRISADAANDRLTEVLSTLPRRDVWVNTVVQQLIDILSLPAWRRRHELYSVWVGTRLLEVARADAEAFSFQTVDDVLSFSFGGSQLATYVREGQQHEIWAELRSGLLSPSVKRQKEIQPDFRVVTSGLADAGQRTRYVLEIKHYLRSSKSNFSAAAKDYAASCPKAAVHVVNHGPASDADLRQALPPELQSRVRFFGDVTPGSPAATSDLPDAIRQVLFDTDATKRAAPLQRKPRPAAALPPGLVAQIHLVWDDSLQDMDLALHTLDEFGNSTSTVNFQHRGELASPPFARLETDVRHGPGAERIDIQSWYFPRYELVATNYSRDGTMTPAALSCRIDTARESLLIPCPDRHRPDEFTWRIAQVTVNGDQILVEQIDGETNGPVELTS